MFSHGGIATAVTAGRTRGLTLFCNIRDGGRSSCASPSPSRSGLQPRAVLSLLATQPCTGRGLIPLCPWPTYCLYTRGWEINYKSSSIHKPTNTSQILHFFFLMNQGLFDHRSHIIVTNSLLLKLGPVSLPAAVCQTPGLGIVVLPNRSCKAPHLLTPTCDKEEEE